MNTDVGKKYSHNTEQAIEISNISLNCYHDLHMFALWLDYARDWASKETHYQNLDQWFKNINQCIHNNLNKYGFINGKGPTNNDSKLWWTIYQIDPTTSPNLKTTVENHHSSAFERNEVMIIEIEKIIKNFENKIFG